MRIKRIMKRLIFEEKNRSNITLGTGVRLHPQENNLQLSVVNEKYSTSPNLYAKTWIFNPNSVIRFIGFDVVAINYEKYDGTYYTSLGFRLSDGTNEYYWNGSSWEINTSDWNTEAEVSANISSFPVTSKSLQVVINLVTNDVSYTPVVYEIIILYESNVDFQDDLFYNSVLPYLENVKPISDYIVTLSTTGSTIDLDDYPLETPYNIVDIDSCFNYTDDPNLTTDIFSSYDSGTKVITLTGSVDSGKKVWIKFIYRPVVSISTDQEYVEVSEVPAIHVLNYEVTNNVLVTRSMAVRNKGAGTAVKALKSRQKTYEFTAASVTGSAIDQQRLQDEIRTVFDNNSFINSNGLDEDFTIYISSDFSAQTEKVDMLTYTSIFRFVIRDVVFLMGVEDTNVIERFVISGDVEATIS